MNELYFRRCLKQLFCAYDIWYQPNNAKGYTSIFVSTLYFSSFVICICFTCVVSVCFLVSSAVCPYEYLLTLYGTMILIIELH